jgi:hypothetical protein
VLNDPLHAVDPWDIILVDSRIPGQCRSNAAMKTSSPERLKHRVARALCVFLACGAIAPSTARAGCGHTVTSNVSRSAQGSLSGPELVGFSAERTGDFSSGNPRRNRPCAGLSCSSEERGSPWSPASSFSPRIEACCCEMSALRWTGQHGDYRSAEPVVAHPRHGTFPIDRPPRFPHLHTPS